MPISVTGPDNITIQFPDGTDAGTINAVMSRHFGGGKSSPLTTGDLARAAARGIPIAGAWANNAIAGAESLAGHGKYEDNLKEENEREARFEAEHPIANTVAGLVGGVATTGGLGMTGLGARALGLGGRTLLGQMGRGALSGATINAADAMARGSDPGVAAAAGAGLGFAAPGAARLIGGAISPTVSLVRGMMNPGQEAARRAGTAIARDINAGGQGLTQGEFARATAQGLPVLPADMGGETARALARSAANTSPEGRQLLDRAIDARFESQAPRLADWFRQGLNFPSEAARDQAIRDVAQNVYEPAYARAYARRAGTLLWPDRDLMTAQGFTPEQRAAAEGLASLAQAPEVQTAIRNAQPLLRNWAVRDGLRPPSPAFTFDNSGPVQRTVLTPTSGGNTNLPSLQLWDYVKRALDRMGTPTAATFSRELRNNLDVLVPEYRAARDLAQPVKFFNGAGNAFEAGQGFINRGIQFGPDAAAALNRMTPQERALFQDGYATSLIDKIERSGDRRNIINSIYNTPAARNEIVTALGQQRANALEARLHIESIMDRARGAVQGNSTTARQLAELGLAGAGGAVLGGGNPLSGDPASLATSALLYSALRGRHALGTAVDERVSREVARMLTSNPQQIQLAMQMITRNGNLLRNLRRFNAALAVSGAAQINQQNTPALPPPVRALPPPQSAPAQ